MKLSVVLATYNEEKKIGECLKSVKDIADEIIVVDGSSKDKTREIAKKYGTKVIEADNPSIFHINKQKAIDFAQGDWILQLDADERLTPSLRDEISNTIIRNPQEDGFWLPRKNFFLGKFLTKGGQYPDLTLRLYRRGKGKLPCKSVHEQAEVSGKTGLLTKPMLHYPYLSFSEYINKWNRYTDLIGDELIRINRKPTIGLYLTYMVLLPIWTFILLFVRHKGFVDGFPGFVFAFFSSSRFMVGYIKFWEQYDANRL